MATGGEARQKGVEELEKEVTCSVCHDHFQEPKILPCLHYYCKACVQKLAWRAGANQPFHCPECRTDTFLPQDDPDQLPTAFFVNRMKDVHAKLEKVEGKVKAKCEQCCGGVATAFCRHCMDFICADCVKSHKRLKVYAGHEVSSLEDLKKGGARAIVAKLPPPPICKVHEEQAKIYCYDCKSLICRDCVVKDHKEHEYEFVKKAAPETKKKLMEQLVPLNEIQVGVRNAVKNVEETKSEIAAMGGSMITSIKQSFQKLRDILDKRERELLAETASVVEQKTNRLDVQQKKLEMCSGTIQSLVEFVERNIENSTDEELMSIHAQMMSRIREETERQRQAGADLEPVEKADRVVVVKCADALKRQCRENARIVALPVNITMENTEAVVGQRSQLSFRLTTDDGQPFNKLHSAKVILTSKVDGSRDAKVIRRQRNSYQIEFTPTVRGRHQLEVIYNDTPVLKGPVQIFVKIPPTQLGKPVRSIDVEEGVNFVAFNSSEELLVTTDKEILAFDKSGEKLYCIKNEALVKPRGIAVDGDNIYVIDYVVSNHCLLKFDKTGKLLKSGGQTRGGEGELIGPCGVTVVGDQVFVCDCLNNRLQVFTSDLVFVRQIGSEGSGNGQFKYPFDITHDEEGNLYTTDCGNDRVQVFNTQGKFLRLLTTKGDITAPKGICISGELVYVSQKEKNGQLFLYHKNGHKVCSFTCESGALGIWGIAIDQDGFIYACNVRKNEVIIF